MYLCIWPRISSPNRRKSLIFLRPPCPQHTKMYEEVSNSSPALNEVWGAISIAGPGLAMTTIRMTLNVTSWVQVMFWLLGLLKSHYTQTEESASIRIPGQYSA